MSERPYHLDLFSGIGGFAIAAGWAGYSTRVFCEQDEYCTKVLNRHWPGVPVIRDIREFDGTQWRGADLLTGGFPCQPFSQAGEQRGEEDDRHLWPEMFRIIKEARPRFVLAENVTGIIKMALDDVLSQLEGEGYTTGAVVLPACAVNTPHRRDRVWICAYSKGAGTGADQRRIRGLSQRCSDGAQRVGQEDVVDSDSSLRPRVNRREEQAIRPTGRGEDVAHADKPRSQGWQREIMPERAREWSAGASGNQGNTGGQFKSSMGLLADGIPSGLAGGGWWDTEPDTPRVTTGVKDRRRKLMALGNAIVPQLGYEILKLTLNTKH